MFKHKNGILLRKLERVDLELLMHLKNESWQNTHQVSIVNMEDQLRWFDSLTNASTPNCPKQLVLIAETENDKGHEVPVGVFKLFGIDWYSRRADAGWDIFAESRGKGLGKKLVQAGVDYCRFLLGLHRLRADILENNEASIKCAVAAGFVNEGKEKEAVLKTGRYLDSLVFGNILDV